MSLHRRAGSGGDRVHVRRCVYRDFMTTKRVQRRRGPRSATPVDLLALTGAAGPFTEERPDVAAAENTGETGETPSLSRVTPPSRTQYGNRWVLAWCNAEPVRCPTRRA